MGGGKVVYRASGRGPEAGSDGMGTYHRAKGPSVGKLYRIV